MTTIAIETRTTPTDVPKEGIDFSERLKNTVDLWQERCDEIGLRYHGNLTPNSKDKPLTLCDATIAAIVAMTHPLLVGGTGKGKSIYANALLKSFCSSWATVWCKHFLDRDDVVSKLEPHGNTMRVTDSEAVQSEGVCLEEMTRLMGDAQVSIKSLVSMSHPATKLVVGTTNPRTYIGTKRFDRSLAASFVYLNVDLATSISDELLVNRSKAILNRDVHQSQLRIESGEPIIDELICLRGELHTAVEIDEKASIFLDCLTANSCIKTWGGRKPEQLNENHCAICACNPASSCGLIGGVSTPFRIRAFASAIAALHFSRGLIDKPIVDGDLICQVLPLFLTDDTAHIRNDGMCTEEQVLSFAAGLNESIERFEAAYGDSLDKGDPSQENVLSDAQQKALKSFSENDNPSVVQAMLARAQSVKETE